MRANTVEIKITPDFPAMMAGFPDPEHRCAEGVHDDLWAHCFYIENDGEEYAIITLDLIDYGKWLVRRLREKIEAKTGIPQNHCMICCTHTHSGPEPRAVPYYKPEEKDVAYPRYLDETENRIADGLAEAKASAFPAKIGFGRGHCGAEQNVGGNRRDKNGPADPSVWVLSITDLLGNPKGVIVRYALHPTFLGAENRLITCDYPNYIYRCVKNEYPGAAVGFQIGTAGDQSSRHFRSGCTFSEAERVGTAIGKEALRVLKEITYNENPKIGVWQTEIYPPKRRILPYEQALAEAKQAHENLKHARESGAPIGHIRTLECAVFGAEGMLTLSQIGEETVHGMDANHPFEIFLLAIDDLRIVGLPVEMFVEYGLRLYERSPFKKTYIACCTGGWARGYICTPQAHAEGGYEALGSLYPPETGDILMDAALKLLEQSESI